MLELVPSIADYPQLVSEWDRSRNRPLTPDQLSHGSARRVWWQCRKSRRHVWEASAEARTLGKTGCPFCSHRRVLPSESLAREAPRLASEWYAKGNGALRPEQVSCGSGLRVWWRCKQGHAWQAAIVARARAGTGCPYCLGRRTPPERSLAVLAPEVAAQWHPIKNAPLTPRDVTLSSAKVIWWKCKVGPDHEWCTTVQNRTAPGTRGRSGRCPFCANKKLSVTNSVARRAPKLASEWHPTRNTRRPEQVIFGSNQRIWWKCPRGPDHEWACPCDARTVRRTGCPFCANQRVSVTNSLAHLFPTIANEWHPSKNGRTHPSDVLAGARKRYWWRCSTGHEFEASPSARTRGNGTCPICHPRRRAVASNRGRLRQSSKRR
jgi:hypothetical protein